MIDKNKVFIEKAIKIHGSRYGYTFINYINSYTKITITCSKHGDFEQTPANHTHKNNAQGCPRCGREAQGESKSYGVDEFIAKAKELHNSLYTYNSSTYTRANIKTIVTCSIHGDFTITPNNHLRGKGCPSCSGNLKHTTATFIEKSLVIHNGLYGYDKTNYSNNSTKVKIKCPIHGYFEQTPAMHLLGSGCLQCGKMRIGCSRTDFISNCENNNNGLGILYIIRCFNATESFYKIGITSKSVKSRYNCKNKMPYTYETLYEKEDSPVSIFNLENELLKELVDHRYTPLISFAGQTECFSKIDQSLTIKG